MKKISRISNKEEVLNLLVEFEDIFPRLKNKVPDMDSWAEKLSRYASVYAGIDEGKTFGILVMYANNTETKKGYISLVGVFEEHRGKRFGKFLLNAAEQVAKENGMNKMGLEVDDYNTHAQEFYRLNGYKYCGQASESSRYMEKDI